MKFCGMPAFQSPPRTDPPLCDSLQPERQVGGGGLLALVPAAGAGAALGTLRLTPAGIAKRATSRIEDQTGEMPTPVIDFDQETALPTAVSGLWSIYCT